MYTRPKHLLSKGTTNAKTAKNSLESYILYMAPHATNDSGVNLCPSSSAGCRAACLYSSGRGRFTNVQQSRINKSNYYVEDRFLFLEQLHGELQKLQERAAKLGTKIAIRLNGTTDLPLYKMLKADKRGWDNLVFYDYTKIAAKAVKYARSEHYIVTFSRSEDPRNQHDCINVLEAGGNVAMVFSTDKFPDKYMEYPVVDGDQSDIMMLYNRGVILGLKAKGDAKKDKSGFVIQL